ncbi:DUF3617 family protein [Sphingomonas sp. LY29]|uniref:DUF3617 domain-containing protein n=1 Tax=unclassified Sphingomonas TaxID=196159 RepID=UPI002ADEF490|nr:MULTISPECIES: DUF3617 family protein [unclassified Sphingomonas]MEA1072140.1 DUF3617 family protein [Sphingomonas sp. LY160]WRP25196.1 DUF3617 family protein [Sphingomonas sp. LY29]
MRLIAITAMSVLAASCGSEAPPPPAPEKAAQLQAGEYEVTGEVLKLASLDKTTPGTAYKAKGEKTTRRACVAADGTIDPAMFVEKGDKCTVQNSYVRSGRISIQYGCTRSGKGAVQAGADGNYTADGFEALVTAASTFTGTGDYELQEKVTGKRVGACPAPAAG